MFAIHALMPLGRLNEESWNDPDKNGGWEMGTWTMSPYLDLFEEAGIDKKLVNPYISHARILIPGLPEPVKVTYKFSEEEQKRILSAYLRHPIEAKTKGGKIYQVRYNFIDYGGEANYIQKFEDLWKQPDIVWYNA